MARTRGTDRKTNQERINVPLLLVCLAHISRKGGMAMPELLDVAKESGWPVSRPTLNRLLTDAEYHLGVRVRWRRDNSLPSHGEYWIEGWGVLDSRKVLDRVSTHRHATEPKWHENTRQKSRQENTVIAATITVEWGYEPHSITLVPRNWKKVKSGQPLSIRGKGYYYEGEFFWDYWDFSGGMDGELIVTYGEDGGTGWEGTLADTDSIEEFEYQPKPEK